MVAASGPRFHLSVEPSRAGQALPADAPEGTTQARAAEAAAEQQLVRDEAHDAKRVKDDEVAEAGDRDAAAGLAVDPKARAEEELEQRKNGDGLRLDRQGKQPDEERA